MLILIYLQIITFQHRSIMRTLVLLILLFGNITLSKAATEPIPPPIKERRALTITNLDPNFDNHIEWVYPAEGLFTWVIATGVTTQGFMANLYCHNYLADNQRNHRIVAIYGLSFYDLIYGNDWSRGWVEEYHNFNRTIRQWHFTASYTTDTYNEDCVAAFLCYDDIPDYDNNFRYV